MKRSPLRPTGILRRHRRATALILIVGLLGTATVLSTAVAVADPGARSSHAPGRAGSANPGNTTGAHHIDPFGYHHTDASPLQQNEHRNALREYRNQQNPAEATENRGGGASTWTAVPRSDGDGWVVCRPTASWC
ncbi:hypothetical protein ACIA8C_01910 [Nocardia sp. NPDC051321]|uniref:hypothetical protein n=1 Tax=Nocardia sp. NPDC051321 TaxID=3364323 RepID=UPI00378B97F7